MRDPLADATAVESPAADPLAGAIRMGATMQATSDPLSAARQIPTVESETLQHGPISRILDILPQLAYDMTVGPLVSAGQVLREGRTPEQAQAWEQMTPEQRAVAKESGQGSASPFTLSPEMFGPQLGAIQNLAIMGALGEQGGVGAVPMGAGRGFLKPKTQPAPATTTVPSPTPVLPPELQDVVNGDATAFLKPPVNEGTVPTVGEQVLQGMDLKKVAGQTGMGYFKGRDGTEVIFNPDLTKTSALKVLDKQGKLPEIVNGPGTAPKPAVPTDAVVVKSPDGTEIRTILTDTPEKTAAAVEAQPSTAQVEVKPAAEVVPQVIQDRMQAIRTNVEDARTSIPTGKQFYRDQEGNIITTGAAKSIREYLSGDFPELRELPNVGPKEIVQAIDKDRGNKLYLQIKDAIEHQMTREAANPETVVTRPPDFEEFSRLVDELAAQEKAPLATSNAAPSTQPKLFQTQATMPPEGLQAKAPQVEHGDLLEGLKPQEPTRQTDFGFGQAFVQANAEALKPLSEGIEKGVKIADDIRKTFAPASRGPQAQQMAGIVREGAARLAASTERAQQGLKQAEAFMDSLPKDQQITFMGSMERGGPQPTKEMQAISTSLRSILDQRRTEVQDLGKGYLENYIENYFPHIWKDPEQARNVFAQYYGRRPLGGPQAFLKKRTLPTIEDGIALGLEPVSTNPVTMTLLKIREMDRFLMKERIVDEMKSEGLARFVRFGQQAPEGWAKVQDKAFRTLQYSEQEKGFVVRGEYYAPEPAARILNNYLSPGLRGNVAYDLYRGVGNSLNQAQLGISAFHLGFTALDTAVSRVALGIQQLSTGQSGQGLTNILAGLTPFKAPTTSYKLGNQMLKEFYKPGSMSPEIAAYVDNYIKGGGRFVMDRFYSNSAVENFWKAWRTGQVATATRTAFPALVEALAKPTMEVIVPRMKAGVFAELSRFELSKLPPNATQTQIRAALDRAVDSVDNRLGQMVYDNLFWNRTMKDLGLASVRSLGWNLGTAREIVGGLTDIPKQTMRAMRGQGFEVTPKMAYVVSLPVVIGLYGGMMNYLFTGEGPQELKDYYFPRTGQTRDDGRPARVSLPSYMKDLFAYAKHPLTTLGHKVNPVVSTVIDMLNNEDYYGAAIRNPDDPIVQQAADEFTFAAKQYEPFSFRGVRQQMKSGASLPAALPSFIGVVPAPASIERSTDVQAQIERRRMLPAIRKKLRQELNQ